VQGGLAQFWQIQGDNSRAGRAAPQDVHQAIVGRAKILDLSIDEKRWRKRTTASAPGTRTPG
jgi:hypothetical protein